MEVAAIVKHGRMPTPEELAEIEAAQKALSTPTPPVAVEPTATPPVAVEPPPMPAPQPPDGTAL